MADKAVKKARKRKDALENRPDEKDEPTKEEYKIGKWMRKNVATKRTKFLNHTVEYFTGSKAIDKLLDSQWATPGKKGEEALFTTRESVVEYMNTMLRHKFFHRARKIAVSESELKSKKKGKEKDAKNEENKEKDKEDDKVEEVQEKDDKSKKDETVTAAESSQAEGEKVDTKEEKKKKKQESEKKRRKIRLDMHLEQRFVDSSDAYVWIYEPVPYYNYIFGLLVVVAVIAVCLFPLWPSSVRQGVYYLSLAAAGFLVFILALTVIRMLVFGIVWGVTFGKHHLWLLPNLTEDVGFMASFWPLYQYEYKPGDTKSTKKSNGSNNTDEQTANNDDSDEGNPTVAVNNSESESEGSQRSQTGKDFEMVNKEEAVDNS